MYSSRGEKFKEKVDIIREKNKKLLSTTENYNKLKQELYKIENKGLEFNVDYTYYERIQQQAYKQVKRCLRRDKSFIILPIIEEMGLSSFFDLIIEGDKLIEINEKEKKKEFRKITRVRERIKEAVEKGDFDTEQKERNNLEELENPEKYYSEMYKVKEILKKMNADVDSSEYHHSYLEVDKKLREYEKEKAENTETIDKIEFTKGVRYDMREYIISLFFTKNSTLSESTERFLKGFNGDIYIDLEHIYLLYNYMVKHNLKHTIRIRGLLYYFIIYEIHKTLKEIKKVTRYTNKVKVEYLKDNTDFGIKNFEFINRYYIMDMLRPKGYNYYYIEPENINTMGLLISKKIEEMEYGRLKTKFMESQKMLRDKKEGVLFSFLTQEKENKILPYILNYAYPVNYMEGEYHTDIYKEFVLKYIREEQIEDIDMYSMLVQPVTLDMIGSLIYWRLSNVERLIKKDLVYIDYITANRITIAVNKNITEEEKEEIFGETWGILKEVKKSTLKELFDGDIL